MHLNESIAIGKILAWFVGAVFVMGATWKAISISIEESVILKNRAATIEQSIGVMKTDIAVIKQKQDATVDVVAAQGQELRQQRSDIKKILAVVAARGYPEAGNE